MTSPQFLRVHLLLTKIWGGTHVKSLSHKILWILAVPLLTYFCQTVQADADKPFDHEGSLTLQSSKPLHAGTDIDKHQVVIWSDGTRMVGDIYKPKELSKEEKLPAIIFCNGTGGTKDGTPARLAPLFVQNGFIFLAFDYRGWGHSDSKLMLVDRMPQVDANGETTARVKPIRWQLDFADQTCDIRNAISFIEGEPNVDPDRIGIMGSSYGGGLVTWIAGNDPRVKCVVAQVPGMAGGRKGAAEKASYALATKQARGETEPVPIETGKLTGKMERFPQMRRNPAKSIGYSPIEAANKIDIPMLIVVAENDELVNNDANGKKVYDIVKSKGNVPVAYHLIKNIGHFDVYGKGLKEAFELELQWYQEHLKDSLSTNPAHTVVDSI